MKKRQKGSITVEATLFLPLFFLAFVSIYSLISFTRAQLIVQYAADQAAKEVAQYSYILEKIGILDSLDGLNSRSEDFEKNIKSIEEQLQTVQQAGENALNGEDPVGNTIEAGKAAKDAYGTVSGYVDDPESFISGVLAVFKKYGIALSHSSRAQANEGTKISASDLKPGDLIFYGNGKGNINHVAIYIGGGQVIHASSPKTGIKISSYKYRTPVKCVRVIQD